MTRAATCPDLTPDSTRIDDYDFELPAHCIAQQPAAQRDGGRLLVLDRAAKARHHAQVLDFPKYLAPGDLVVLNDTRVIPARIKATLGSGGEAELLVAHPLADEAEGQQTLWRCLGKPGRRLRAGSTIAVFGDRRAEIVANHGDGQIDVRFGVDDLATELDRFGEVPLPPYIARQAGPTPADRERYQTIYAERPGAVAAPTAGLHFSQKLLDALRDRDVGIATLTLHVGPGTFLPVRSADARDHRLLPERYSLPRETVESIERTQRNGSRVVAVGTTTTRALESAAAAGGLRGGDGWADGFILPGHRFRVVDALVTNFHLPRSTLLLLVSAFAGRASILDAYADAIDRGYRFYSYGDAMFIR